MENSLIMTWAGVVGPVWSQGVDSVDVPDGPGGLARSLEALPSRRRMNARLANRIDEVERIAGAQLDLIARQNGPPKELLHMLRKLDVQPRMNLLIA